MSTYEIIPYATTLDQFPWVLKYLDSRYGTYDIKEYKKNGEYTIRYILKHLSYNKESTCEEIAKDEYENNIQSLRKLKSITDDVRKFIVNNLIPTQLVYHGEPKKKYNKNVTTYSLSPIGVMYAIHLFGRVIENKTRSYDWEKIDIKFIKSIAKVHTQTLPKIFGKFQFFEKALEDDFDDVLIGSIIPIFGHGMSDFMILENYLVNMC